MNDRTRFVRAACLALGLAACGLSLGCHSGPTVRTSYEPGADFSRFIDQEIVRWNAIARAANIQLE